jgi:dienelactone hydrolase
MDETNKLTRRAAIQAAAILAACGVASAQTPAAIPAKPKTRDCIWIPTIDGKYLCAMIHRPVELKEKAPAALLIHGIVGSKDQPHRILVALAEALAAMGVVALRFDLLGRGDSEGESIDATPQRDLQNARDALAVLQTIDNVDARDITAIGISWGGTLAAQLTGESTAIKRIVLIASCPKDNETWQPKLEDFSGREASDQFGMLLSKEFFDGFAELTPLSALRKNRQPVLMVYGTRDEAIRQDDYDTCKDELAFADVAVKAAKITAADHNLLRHEAERQMIEQVTTWLKQQA